MAKERIGLLGGTFNPIHAGHIGMALAACQEARLDRVLVIPTGNPPHKTGIAPAEDRWKMVCAACAQEHSLEPCRIELDRDGVIYTVDTLALLKKQFPKAALFYIIGADTLMELQNWRHYQQVLQMCTFLVCPRTWRYTPSQLEDERQRLEALGGHLIMLTMDTMDVSSSGLRDDLAAGRPTPMLPVPLQEYCAIKGLYFSVSRLPIAQPWLDRLFADLTPKRFAHTLAVAHTARQLALVHGMDPQQAEIAGLLHDCAKCLPLAQMQSLAQAHGLTDDPESSGNLLHAAVGAYLARTAYAVTDPAVLQAILHHTTGAPGMTKLDMVVYLADKIEPTRTAYPLLDTVRRLAQFSLEKAMLSSLEGTAQYVKKSGKPLHPSTLHTLQWLRTLPPCHTIDSQGE